MFTGIIQEVGTIQSVRLMGSSAELIIQAPNVCRDAVTGDSICVSGVCLTAAQIMGGAFRADVSQETLKRTTLQSVQPDDAVNIEPSLRPQDRMGGHIVSGHVDAVGTILQMEDLGEFINMTVQYPKHLVALIAEKGSIAVDGISLTVTHVTDDTFGVALVPYTIQHTNLQHKHSGSPVNLEVDVLARYVQRMLKVESSNSGITIAKLREHGFV